MLKRKKALVMSVLYAVASAGFVASASAADTTMQGDLAEVVVEGKKKCRLRICWWLCWKRWKHRCFGASRLYGNTYASYFYYCKSN